MKLYHAARLGASGALRLWIGPVGSHPEKRCVIRCYSMERPPRTLVLPLTAALFFFSAPLLGAEILMLRLSVIEFGADYQYLVIPLAFFGLGAGAAIAAFVRERQWTDALVFSSFVAAIGIAVMLLSGTIFQGDAAALASFAGAIAAYGAAGFLAAIVFRMRGDQIPRLYAADLLGAAVGSLAAPFFLNAIGWRAIPVMIALACAAAALFSVCAKRRRLAIFGGILAALSLAGFFAPPAVTCGGAPEAYARDNAYAHITVLPAPAGAQFEGEPVRDDAAVRTHLLGYDCGATASAVVSGASWDGLRYMTVDLRSVPFEFAAQQGRLHAVLISGAGGGTDIQRAHLFGAQRIDAIEMDPLVVQLTHELSSPTTDAYRVPGLTIRLEDSRHVLLASDATYDLVIAYRLGLFGTISLTADTPVYNLTVESTQELVRRLNGSGILALSRLQYGVPQPNLPVQLVREFNDPIAILAAALRREGIDPAGKIAVLAGHDDPNFSIVLFKRDAWSPEDRAELARLAAERSLASPQYVDAAFLAAHSTALTDDAPFPTALHGAALLAALLALAVLALAAIAALLARRAGRRGAWALHGAYFAFVGAGFVIFELAALVRAELLFAHADYAAGFTLACFLVSAGIASAASAQLSQRSRRRVSALALLGIVLAAALLAYTPAHLLEGLIALALPWRALALAVPLALGGFSAGLYVPFGFARLRPAFETLVPWAWALDASFGVLGGFATKLLFHSVGIAATFAVAALLYALATLSFALINHAAHD